MFPKGEDLLKMSRNLELLILWNRMQTVPDRDIRQTVREILGRTARLSQDHWVYFIDPASIYNALWTIGMRSSPLRKMEPAPVKSEQEVPVVIVQPAPEPEGPATAAPTPPVPVLAAPEATVFREALTARGSEVVFLAMDSGITFDTDDPVAPVAMAPDVPVQYHDRLLRLAPPVMKLCDLTGCDVVVTVGGSSGFVIDGGTWAITSGDAVKIIDNGFVLASGPSGLEWRLAKDLYVGEAPDSATVSKLISERGKLGLVCDPEILREMVFGRAADGKGVLLVRRGVKIPSLKLDTGRCGSAGALPFDQTVQVYVVDSPIDQPLSSLTSLFVRKDGRLQLTSYDTGILNNVAIDDVEVRGPITALTSAYPSVNARVLWGPIVVEVSGYKIVILPEVITLSEYPQMQTLVAALEASGTWASYLVEKQMDGVTAIIRIPVEGHCVLGQIGTARLTAVLAANSQGTGA
jgi:hypothetical protein